MQIYFTDVMLGSLPKLAGREACAVRLGRVRAQGRPMDNLMDGYLGAFGVVGSRQTAFSMASL